MQSGAGLSQAVKLAKQNEHDLTPREFRVECARAGPLSATDRCLWFLKRYRPKWPPDLLYDTCLELLKKQRDNERLSETMSRVGMGSGYTTGYADIKQWQEFRHGHGRGK